MADRPITFSAPMVNALLAGRKTVTRRLIRPTEISLRSPSAPVPPERMVYGKSRDWQGISIAGPAFRLPHLPGDRLYVREHWRAARSYDDLSPRDMGGEEGVRYEADGACGAWTFCPREPGRHRQAMHMPRWASRLTLIITAVDVHRLDEMTDRDALAEGVTAHENGGYWVPGVNHPNRDFPYLSKLTPRRMFAALWDTLHGSGEWLKSPWVCATTFTVEQKNIDQAAG